MSELITSLEKTYNIPIMGEFMYRLALCACDTNMCVTHSTRITYQYVYVERINKDSYKTTITFKKGTKTITYDIIYTIKCSVLSTFYTVSVFKSNIAIDIGSRTGHCLALNEHFKDYYMIVQKLLSNKLILELEYIVLDFLNIPHNYDWLKTFFSYIIICPNPI